MQLPSWLTLRCCIFLNEANFPTNLGSWIQELDTRKNKIYISIFRFQRGHLWIQLSPKVPRKFWILDSGFPLTMVGWAGLGGLKLDMQLCALSLKENAGI